MKYHNLAAFEKHLEQDPALLYLIVAPCPHERRSIVASILRAIQKKQAGIELQEAAPNAIDGLIDELNSPSLFSARQVVYLDGIDKLKKGLLSPLVQYAAKPSPFTYLLLGATSGKTLGDLKGVIVCDLSLEKPWDRKDRLKRSLSQYAAKMGKQFKADALEHLLEHVGLDLAGLEQEVLKLSAYVGERAQIELSDVHALCHQVKKATLWQIAESLVWRGTLPTSIERMDLNDLLPLIAILRKELQQGLTIAMLIKQGFGAHEINQQLPALRNLEKIMPLVSARHPGYFKRGLQQLFEMELKAKNSSIDPELLLALFQAKLYPNTFKVWEFDKEAPQISHPARAVVFIDTPRVLDEKFGVKPTPTKTKF